MSDRFLVSAAELFGDGVAAAGCTTTGGALRIMLMPELAGADAIWLASSLRGLAEAVSLDGVPRARSPWTGRLQKLLGGQPLPAGAGRS